MKDVVHKSGVFNPKQQKYIYDAVKKLDGFYTPSLRNGKKMSLEMNCLGWHWNPKSYKYEKCRTDHDGKEVSEIPDWLQEVAQASLRISKYWPDFDRKFDVCICNIYGEKSKLGFHKDNSETRESLDAGYPVVSVSIGTDAVFGIGSSRKKADQEEYTLKSGDVVIFGRSAREHYHGIKKLLEPSSDFEGRLNLTFRVL